MKRIVLFLLLCTALGMAQHVHSTTETAKPAELLEGLGPILTRSATQSGITQTFFDQGLALIYGFNHDGSGALVRAGSRVGSWLAIHSERLRP